MNLENYELDNVTIITTRTERVSTVKVVFEYELINIEASNTCFRSIEKELDLQCDILAALGFNNQQVEELSYE